MYGSQRNVEPGVKPGGGGKAVIHRSNAGHLTVERDGRHFLR